MNDKPNGRTIPKQRLEIVNVEMDISYSQGTKLLDRVHAKDLSLAESDPLFDKPLRLTVFKDDLKSFIRGKTTIVADIEERDRPGSDYGPDRTIVQVYDDQGQPVSKPSAKGGFQGRSPESIRLEYSLKAQIENQERISIEGQSMVNQVGGLVLAVANGAKLEGVGLDLAAFERLQGKYWKAVEKGLDNFLAAKPLEIKAPPPVAAAPGNAPGKTQEEQGTGERPAADRKDVPPPGDPLKNVGDLLTRASKLKPPVSAAELYAALKVKGPTEIKDLPSAWLTACSISEIKKNAGQPKNPAVADQGTKKTAPKNKPPEKLFE